MNDLETRDVQEDYESFLNLLSLNRVNRKDILPEQSIIQLASNLIQPAQGYKRSISGGDFDNQIYLTNQDTDQNPVKRSRKKRRTERRTERRPESNSNIVIEELPRDFQKDYTSFLIRYILEHYFDICQ